MRVKKKISPKVSAGSMADIAFLLLIFFLVATNLQPDKGLMIQLPPDDEPVVVEMKDRNVLNIQINSKNQFMIEEDIRDDVEGLTQEVLDFIENREQREDWSESPEKAIISIKTQRGTKYKNFIDVLDAAKEAYYIIYAKRVGLSSDEFKALNLNKPDEFDRYQTARAGLPMAISIANPDL